MQYYANLKKKEILLHSTIWISINHCPTQNKPIIKGQIPYNSTHEVSEVAKIRDRVETWLPSAEESGWGKLVFSGYRVSVVQVEKVLEICCTTM